MNKEIDSHFFTEVVDAVQDGLMVVATDGKILKVNQALEVLTGYSRRELEGVLCDVLNCDACEVIRSESQEKWCMLFEKERVRNKRCLFMRKNGAYMSVIKNASVLKDEKGVIVGAVETFTDISDIERRDLKISELSRALDEADGFYGMIGRSIVMQRIFQIIEKAAESDAPVIVYGESGTGKELVARAIHEIGRRRDGPFIQFNCAALNEALLESELFGHIKGAFTGAYRHRMGRFEAAHGGDIFLDEIGDIPEPSQAKLLRVLEMKQFERVGDHRPVNVDVRIISATNQDLSKLVSLGKFRQDLFFRINVLPIHLPPLRERKEDIPLLMNLFIRQLQEQTGKAISGVTPEVMDLFLEYEWPGNVRELKSALEYAFAIAESGMIKLAHVPEHIARAARCKADDSKSQIPAEHGDDSPEKRALIEALRESGGNKSKAAKILGVHRMTVWNRMKKHGIVIKKDLET